jgi:hypothetical protein
MVAGTMATTDNVAMTPYPQKVIWRERFSRKTMTRTISVERFSRGQQLIEHNALLSGFVMGIK